MNTLEWVRGMVRLYAHHPAHSACWESPSHPMISYVGESWCIWMSGASPQLCRTLSERPLSLLLCSRVWSCDLHDQREGRRLGEKQKEISEDIKQMWIQLYVSESITKPTHVPKRTLSLWIPPTGPWAFPVFCAPQPTPPPTIYPAYCASCQQRWEWVLASCYWTYEESSLQSVDQGEIPTWDLALPLEKQKAGCQSPGCCTVKCREAMQV